MNYKYLYRKKNVCFRCKYYKAFGIYLRVIHLHSPVTILAETQAKRIKLRIKVKKGWAAAKWKMLCEKDSDSIAGIAKVSNPGKLLPVQTDQQFLTFLHLAAHWQVSQGTPLVCLSRSTRLPMERGSHPSMALTNICVQMFSPKVSPNVSQDSSWKSLV